MTLTQCPRFSTCSAPICPLASDWRLAEYVRGEQVCRYLLDSAKDGAESKYFNDPVFSSVVEQRDEICRQHPNIAHRVAAASRTGFMGGNLRGKSGRQGLQTRTVSAIAGQVGVSDRIVSGASAARCPSALAPPRQPQEESR